MAVKFGQNSYLDRAATWFNAAANWTWFFYAERATAGTPSGGQFINYLSYGDSAFTNPYIAVRTAINTNDMGLRVWDGTTLTVSTTYTPTNLVWTWLAVTYDAATTTLKLIKDGTTIDSIVVDLSTFVFVQKDNLTNWTSGAAAFGLYGLSSVRIWQTKLTDVELTAEAASPTAVKTASLLSDTPLPGPVDFYDESGNNRDWTPHYNFGSTSPEYIIGPTFNGQFAGAIGLFGGFSRIEANNIPGLIRLAVGVPAPACSDNTSTVLWVRVSPAYVSGTWPTNPLCAICGIWVEWIENTGARQFSTVMYSDLVGSYNPVSGGVANCNPDGQSVEIKFKFGTYDKATGLHAADGSWELRVNGAVIDSRTGIALGKQNFHSYDQLIITPAGGLDNPGVPPPQSNAGLTVLYVNQIDAYGASVSSYINEVYSGLSAAVLWWDLDVDNPWQRWSNGAPGVYPVQGDPPPFPIGASTGTPGSPAWEVNKVTDNTDFMSIFVTSALLAASLNRSGIYTLSGTGADFSSANPRLTHDVVYTDSVSGSTENMSIPTPFGETFLAGDEK